MESLYRRFDFYDFNSDARFQDGLKKVNTPASKEDLLKFKIFFYNRFVEPIHLSGYKEWCAVQDRSHQIPEEMRSVQDDVGTSGSRKVFLTQTDTEAELAHNTQLSFAEVFQMIQAGEEIPGLQKLDIKPCNHLPTSSQMARKLKPWEK
ncbi:uncharacterized protein LOC113656204 [Tachysurus fulvidraco]|uniref:uncharacterized protein LOC113656204 n=1 Tax=Tachysurus fulvidraco TaxID=1234273 RepID=UPI000F50DD76|nr:uncharacterized protein LOC113656204 [Tachysurus fulvidraco]XP_047678823.1 uncharacterized protein LOC113656204 [Tachysurus fulvidraco]